MVHYFYFPNQSLAEDAGHELRSRGWSIEIRPATLGDQWLLRARATDVVGDTSGCEEEFTELAERLDGEYDGWEGEVNA